MKRELFDQLTFAASSLNVVNGATAMTVDPQELIRLTVQECLAGWQERILTRYQGSDRDSAIAYGMEIVVDEIKQKFQLDDIGARS